MPKKCSILCVSGVPQPNSAMVFPKSNFLFDWSRNLRWSRNGTLVEADPRPPANSEDGVICNNSLRLKAVY